MHYCHTCEKEFKSLGIARHRAMHRDKNENCKITNSFGITSVWNQLILPVFHSRIKTMEQLTQEQVDKLLNESPGQRVTKEYIEHRITDTLFTTLIEGSTVTICQLTIDNGYSVRGESACVDPTNYNKDLGEHYSYENAFKKLWPLFGFLLAEKMYHDKLLAQANLDAANHTHEGQEPEFSVSIGKIDADQATRAKGFYQEQHKDKISLSDGEEDGYLSRMVVVTFEPTEVVKGSLQELLDNSDALIAIPSEVKS